MGIQGSRQAARHVIEKDILSFPHMCNNAFHDQQLHNGSGQGSPPARSVDAGPIRKYVQWTSTHPPAPPTHPKNSPQLLASCRVKVLRRRDQNRRHDSVEGYARAHPHAGSGGLPSGGGHARPGRGVPTLLRKPPLVQDAQPSVRRRSDNRGVIGTRCGGDKSGCVWR